MTGRPINENLIGVARGRAGLQTPALVIDLAILERNLERMAEHARKRKISLRPHAKTHKSVEIAKRQIALGAVGVCVAKLGEAEALAEGGIQSILVTSPVVTREGISRAITLNRKIDELLLVCDNPEIAAFLAEAARSGGKPLKILVDIDPGLGRTGVRASEALAQVERIAAEDHLIFAGLQCYAGQVQHLESRNERRQQSLTAMKNLSELRESLARAGLAPSVVSGGGTGTFDIDPDANVLTELQVGSYVFMDCQYNDVWQKSDEPLPFETSLFVQTTVISANRRGLATTDAGLKAFATDAGPPRIASGAPEGASYFFFGDEQGGVTFPKEGKSLMPRDVISCVVPHCDPTVNLYEHYHVVKGDTLEAIWTIDSRGRSA
ncbi:MAG: DSD1 family PLP-dependent enzyme [Alphaproteobacteria bacterium]|nr:DSD1 family PLP-dependent enzyme [Alphaproteobacteria bacterium]